MDDGGDGRDDGEMGGITGRWDGSRGVDGRWGRQVHAYIVQRLTEVYHSNTTPYATSSEDGT